MYKSSYYNVFIPVPENQEYLLYNTYHGGLLILTETEGQIVTSIVSKKQFSLDEYNAHRYFLDTLIKKGYILEANIDETDQYQKKCQDRVNRLFYSDKGTMVLTIATTNACNMQCPYCFEFTKQNNMLSDKSISDLEQYLESVVKNSPKIKTWQGMGVTWYGGEPLVGKEVIGKLTPKLLQFAERHQMKYSAEIITNGTLLTKDTWAFLKENQVKWAQVTVDGIKEIHNKHRPLKNKHEKNYERILENIANMPEGMATTIRVNTDKEVVTNFEKFLDDLNAYGIWPQRYKEIHLSIAWLRTYSQANETDISQRITMDEWGSYYDILRKAKFDYFNQWADKNQIKRGQLAFNIEKPSFEDCWSVISPYSFVIDADGYTHKCWENVHDEDTRIQHISEEYQIEKYREHLNYSRFDWCKDGKECKYLPICGMVSCTQHHFPSCPYASGEFEKSILKEYMQYKRNPGEVVIK